MAEREVKLKLTTVSDQAIQGLTQVRTALDSVTKTAEGVSSKLQSVFKFSLAGVSLAGIAGLSVQLNEIGSKALQARQSFELMAQSTGERAAQMMTDMKAASGGLIGTTDLAQKAAKALAQGLEGEDIIKIVDGARYAARLAGEDVVTAYENITDAIANEMPKALRRYGLVTKEEMSLLTRAMAAGVDDINLAAIALANMEIQKARFAGATDMAWEKVQRFHKEISALKTTLAVGFVEILADVSEAIKKLDYGKIGQHSTALMYAVAAARASKALSDLDKDPESSGYRKKIRMPETIPSVTALADAEAAKQEIVNKLKAAIAEKEDQKRFEQIARLNEQIEGLWARQTLSLEEQASRQAAVWREKGADRILVENWLVNELEHIRAEEYERHIERLNKIYDHEKKNILALAELHADESARSAKTGLDYQKKIVGILAGYGAMSPADELNKNFDIDRSVLEVEQERLRTLIAKKSQYTTEEDLDGQRAILKLAMELKNTEQEISNIEGIRLLRLKEFTGAFSEGFNVGSLLYLERDLASSFNRGVTVSRRTAQNMEQAFSDGFFNVFTGQINSLDDVWKNFCNSMVRVWSDTMAQMVMAQFKGQMSEDGGGFGFGSILGMFGKLLGLKLPGGGGERYMTGEMQGLEDERDAYYAAQEMHTGGVAGYYGGRMRYAPAAAFAGAPRFHFGSDEVPAVLQKGETVIPKGQGAGGGNFVMIQALDAPSLEALMKRNPAAIIGPINQMMKDGKLRNWKGFLGN